MVDIGEGSGIDRVVGKADKDDQVAEVAVVASAGFGRGDAVLFGYDPCLAAYLPFLTGDGKSRSDAQCGGVDGACAVRGGLQPLLVVSLGIDPPARRGLHYGVVVAVVETVIAFVARGKRVHRVAIGLELDDGHVLDIHSLCRVAAKEHCCNKCQFEKTFHIVFRYY